MKKCMFKKVISVVLATILLISLVGCIDAEPSKEVGTTSSAASEVKKGQTFTLNETAVFNTLKITATEIKESSGSTYFTPAEGKIFVGVNFTIENISDEEQTISSILLFDAYVDDVACDLSFTASAAFDGNSLDGTIAPGKKIIGWYAVEVPADWAELELDVKANWLSSSTAKFVFNK